MKYFKEGYGIVTEQDPVTENCNLFYAQYLLLSGNHDYCETFRFFDNMNMKLNARGLYDRRPASDPRAVSHDEITGWMVASYLLNTSHKYAIWDQMLWHFGAYNNNGKEWMPFNPGNYYAWGAYVGSPLRWFFLPIYAVNMAIAINKPKDATSSKIIYWLELYSMPDDWVNRLLRKYYVSKMRKQYGKEWLKGLYEIYFGRENRKEFPLWKELYGFVY